MNNKNELKSERVTTMMTPSEVQMVDDWCFETRTRGRSEAIRYLITRGMKPLSEIVDELSHISNSISTHKTLLEQFREKAAKETVGTIRHSKLENDIRRHELLLEEALGIKEKIIELAESFKK